MHDIFTLLQEQLVLLRFGCSNMALPTAKLDLPFIGGLDQSTNPQLVQPGSWLQLENAYPDKQGRLIKRYGHVTVDPDVYPTYSLDALYSVFNWRDAPHYLGRQTAVGTYAYRKSGNMMFAWNDEEELVMPNGDYNTYTWDVRSIAGIQAVRPSPPWSAVSGGYICTVWGYNDEVWVALHDQISGATIWEPQIIETVTTPPTQPKVVVVDDKFIIVWYDSNNNALKWTYIDPASPGLGITNTWSLANTVGDVYNNSPWDLCATEHDTHGDCFFIAYNDQTGPNNVACRWYTNDGTHRDYAGLATDAGDQIACNHIASKATANEYVVVVWGYDAANNMKWGVLNTDGTWVGWTGGTGATLRTNAGNTCKQIGFCTEGCRNADDVTIFITEDDATNGIQTVVDFGLLTTGAVSGNTHTFIACGLSVWPFEGYDGKAHALLSSYSGQEQDQATYFLASMDDTAGDSSGLITNTDSLLFPSSADSYFTRTLPAQISKVTKFLSKFWYPVLKETSASPPLYEYMVSFVECDIAAKDLKEEDLRDSKLFANSGYLGYFDGQIQEVGFMQYPVITNIAESTTGGGLTATGEYSYMAVYEWLDRLGNIHRSTPSEAEDFTLTGGNDTLTVTVTNLYWGHHRNKLASPGDSRTRICLYRTEASGPIYHLVATTQNDPTAISYSFVDTFSDATASTRELIYTTGGVLPNTTIPAAKFVAAAHDRIFIVPQEDPYTVLYSKPLVTTVGPEFTAPGLFNLEFKEEITGIATLDHNNIVFTEDKIWVFNGYGPNSLGQGAYNLPRLISPGVGCNISGNVWKVPPGIIFQAKEGIYLLDRSLNVTRIGAQVEDWCPTYDMKAVEVDTPVKHIYIALDGATDDTALVWDWESNTWWTHTNFETTSLAFIGNDLYRLVDEDEINIHDKSQWKDDTTTYLWKIQTPWLKTDGIEGFGRLRWVYLLGGHYTDFDVDCTLYHNFDMTTPVDAWSWDITEDPLEKYRKPGKQKMNSFSLLLEEDNPTGTHQGGYLSGLGLVVARKRRKGYTLKLDAKS